MPRMSHIFLSLAVAVYVLALLGAVERRSQRDVVIVIDSAGLNLKPADRTALAAACRTLSAENREAPASACRDAPGGRDCSAP